MAKKQKTRKGVPPVNADLKSKPRNIPSSGDKTTELGLSLFEKINQFLSEHARAIFWIILSLALIVGFLLFDIRFSLSGDDSSYVARAYNFIHHFRSPEFQGPLYPIVLGPFVGLFGLSAIPLKILSLLFLLGSFFFLYKAFNERIPSLLLMALLVLLAINSSILYYGSQTYSEALFMFIQSLTVYLFFKGFIDKEEDKSLVAVWKNQWPLIVCLLCLWLTRFIGFSATLAVGLFFIYRKQWKNLLVLSAAFLSLLILYQGYLLLFSPGSQILFSDLFRDLLSKDYYHPAMGRETAMGFINRFSANTNFYLSGSFYSLLGLSDPAKLVRPDWIVTALTLLAMILAMILLFKRNRYIFFIGVYTLITLFVIFFVAHTLWMQSRFIIPYMSLILLLLLSCIYYALENKGWTRFQLLFPVIILILAGFSLNITAGQVSDARRINSKYYGLTPDWENYCKLSEWTRANLPKNAVVACRKPTISFMFSNGKDFFGISRIPLVSGDSLVRDWKRKNPHYYLLAVSGLDKKSLSANFSREFKRSILGYGMLVKDGNYTVRFLVLNFSEQSRNPMLDELRRLNISISDKADTLKSWLKVKSGEIFLVYPDSALQILRKAHVTHIMTDNIRSLSSQKNDQRKLPMLERFINFIEAKYPGIRTKIMQTGENDNEPSCLYRINYEIVPEKTGGK
ncbi:MAG: hypothetical protein NTW10_06330 [Bacteroidetes bacterium]|nr:hypothetical protein [Bacteroidota bacterium]